MGRGKDREVTTLSPIWRRSLVESAMRKQTTRADMVIVALFLIAAVAIVVRLVLEFFLQT